MIYKSLIFNRDVLYKYSKISIKIILSRKNLKEKQHDRSKI